MDHHLCGRDCTPIPRRMSNGNWHSAWTEAGQRGDSVATGMKGLNALYALPYWDQLLINHLLDPMHCFKNFAVTIWQHMTGLKDNRKSKKD